MRRTITHRVYEEPKFMQMKYGNMYIRYCFLPSTEDEYVVFDPAKKYLFIVRVDPDPELDDTLACQQKKGREYKKITSCEIFFEFLLKHLPESFDSQISRSPTIFEETPEYLSPKRFESCSSNISLKELLKKIGPNSTCQQIVDVLKKHCLQFYECLSPKLKNALEKAPPGSKVSILTYVALKKVLDNNWK